MPQTTSSLAGRFFVALLRRTIEKDCTPKETKNIIESFSSLDRETAVALLTLLMQGPGRFEVRKLSKSWPLLKRGLLIDVHQFNSTAVCELHPALLAKRRQLIGILSRALQPDRSV